MAESCLTTPTIPELTECLSDLVDWDTFGVYLKGIKYGDILSIQKKVSDIDEGKLKLFHKWLSVCPGASWHDIVEALNKARLFTLAEKVKSEKCVSNLKTKRHTGLEDVPNSKKLKTENDLLKSKLVSLQDELTKLQQQNRQLYNDRERVMSGIDERDHQQHQYSEGLTEEIRTMKLIIEKLTKAN